MQDYYEPKVGDLAGNFRLPSTRGKDVTLREYKGQDVILYFYPRDDTPGCTAEACSFRDHEGDLSKAHAVVLGVSTDSLASHDKFLKKYNLNFPLLADTDGKVGRAYGVLGGDGLMAKLKSVAGMADRVTFVIGSDGRIANVIEKPDVGHHAEEVINLL